MNRQQLTDKLDRFREHLILAVSLITIIGLPLSVSGIAAADGTGSFCTNASTPVLCWYADGTRLDQVFGHTLSGGVNERTKVFGVNDCTHGGSPSMFVQSTQHGDATNCPFTVSALDADFDGKEIVKLENVNSTFCFLGTTSATIVQGSCGTTGNEWIQANDGVGTNEYINVFAADKTYNNQTNPNGTSSLCTDNTQNDALLLKSIPVLTNCLWSMH